MSFTYHSTSDDISTIAKEALKANLFSSYKWVMYHTLKNPLKIKQITICCDTESNFFVGVCVIDNEDAICTFVKPKYRKKGIGTTLANITLKNIENKCALVYAYEGLIGVSDLYWSKLGFKRICDYWELRLKCS